MSRIKRSELEVSTDYDLKYWGFHVGKQYAADGYPEDNPILALLSGHSDLNLLSPKFGINVRDIPARAWQINATIMRLPGRHRTVLVGRFCLPVVYETGEPYSATAIAGALHIHVRAYYRLLKEAREMYLRLSAALPVVNPVIKPPRRRVV